MEAGLLLLFWMFTLFIILMCANRWLRRRSPNGVVLDFDPSNRVLHYEDEDPKR